MKKRGAILFLLVLILVSLIFVESSTDSDTQTEVTIKGCTFGGFYARTGSCVLNQYYCKDHNELENVFNTPNACSMGTDTQSASLRDGEICCPAETHACLWDPAAGGYLCVAQKKGCDQYETSSECDSDEAYQQGCFWDGENCVRRIDECHVYTTESLCKEDKQNVAQKDPMCRDYEVSYEAIDSYTILRDSCRCVWNESQCNPEYDIIKTYEIDPNILSTCTFTRTLKTSCDDTTDGMEHYLYKANFNQSQEHQSLLAVDAFCVDREVTRRCGEDLIKIPFFSFFNILLISFLITIFYLIKATSMPKK